MIYEQDISYMICFSVVMTQFTNITITSCSIYNSLDLISLNISVLDSSGLGLRSGQTKDYKIDICFTYPLGTHQ